MILEPKKTAEEIDRRLSALNDPDLAVLLEGLNRSFSSDDIESFTSPEAPYWKRRIAVLALAGLFAMSAGYGFIAFQPSTHPNVRAKPHIVVPPPPRLQHKLAIRHTVAKKQHHFVAPAPVILPNEALVRQERAQLVHERELAAHAAYVHRQAQLARQAQAAAQAHAQAAALAQARAEARAEALAQARAEALAQARAEALARAQDEAAAQARQDWVVQNASGPGTKPAGVPPTDTGRISTYPRPGIPAPMPGPIDPNCTPHRGSLFTTAVNAGLLDHVRLGGTSVGGVLRLIHQ